MDELFIEHGPSRRAYFGAGERGRTSATSSEFVITTFFPIV